MRKPREWRVRWPLGHRVAVDSVVLSVLLVLATATAVVVAVTIQVDRQIEENAERRLRDGAAVFTDQLSETREDARAIADWLSRDVPLAQAIASEDRDAINARLLLSVRMSALDEVTVRDRELTQVGQFRAGRSSSQPVSARSANASSANARGGGQAGAARSDVMQQVLAGRSVDGIHAGPNGNVRQEVSAPVWLPENPLPVGVITLATDIDDADLERFRQQTGLEVSVFIGSARLITTLRNDSGEPLRSVDADPQTLQAVMANGQSLFAWRELPIGRFRSYYVPIVGPDGRRVGMLSIGVPLRALRQELFGTLWPVMPVVALILLTGAGASYLVFSQMRQPLRQLAQAAERLRSGDLTTPVPHVTELDLAPLAVQLELARLSLREREHSAVIEDLRLRALFSTLREPVVTTSVNFLVTGFNEAAAALFGNLSHYYGRHVTELLPFVSTSEPSLAALDVSDRPVLAGGAQADATAWAARGWQGRIARQNGKPLEVAVNCATLVEGQLPASRVFFVHDVSHLVELSRLREQLLYSVAHELRTPLSALNTALEIVSEEYAELSVAEVEQLLQSTRRAAGRLNALIEDLLNAGNIQSGRFTVTPQPVRLVALIDDALDSIEPALKQRRQWVETAVPHEALWVRADARYARQVLTNLLGNASKFGPLEQPIDLRVEMAEGFARIKVIDRGPGIPADEQQAIFEPFHRIPADQKAPGVGLGLAIAKGIVTAHGGTIGLTSEVGQGTTVWFTLPLATPPDEQVAAI